MNAKNLPRLHVGQELSFRGRRVRVVEIIETHGALIMVDRVRVQTIGTHNRSHWVSRFETLKELGAF